MPNFRWGVTAAVIAFFISTGLGILSGVSIFHIILRAILFGIVFFGFGFGARFVIDTYFPELLFMDEGSERDDAMDQPGARIDINLNASGEYAVPELYKSSGDGEELGNIDDLISGAFKPRQEGIDQKAEEGYNGKGSVSVDAVQGIQEMDSFNFPEAALFEKPKEEMPVFTPSFGDDSTGLGGLPDLETMALAFSGGGSGFSGPAAGPTAGSSAGSSIASPLPIEDIDSSSYYKGNKSQQLEGDFNPKALAEGIRTVLSKD
jgi:hypothetical protein